MSEKKKLEKALVAAGKLTVADKKLVIESIKLRYNGIISALNKSTEHAASAKRKSSGDARFPFSLYEDYVSGYLGNLQPKLRSKAEKLFDLMRVFLNEHNRETEAINRIINEMRSKSERVVQSLIAERDELILQVSLIGSSDAANKIIQSLRTPEEIITEMRKAGVEVTAEAMQITGIGYPSPKQLPIE